jgi:hypothetical protein
LRASRPFGIHALAEDDCRLIAESALLDFGERAHTELLKAATTPSASEDSESETSIRARASALGLLLEIGVPQETWPSLRQLMLSRQPRTALLACELCLSNAPQAEWRSAVRRLVELLKDAHWRLESDIEEFLVRHYANAGKSISAILRNHAADEAAVCYKRHRASEFLDFLKEIDARVPDDLDVHVVMDITPPTRRRESRPGWQDARATMSTSRRRLRPGSIR